MRTLPYLKCAAELTDELPITVGVHQGSAFAPVLFIIVKNYVLRDLLDISDLVHIEFADDMLMLSENSTVLQNAFNEWARALESNELRNIVVPILGSNKPVS